MAHTANRFETQSSLTVPLMTGGGSPTPGKVDFNDPKVWQQKIALGLDARKQYSAEDRWTEIEQYWLHDYPEGDPAFNMVYMFGRSLIPSLIFSNPHVTNVPLNPGAVGYAQMWDSVDNWLVKEMEIGETIKSAVLNAYLYNMAAIETGFDFPDSSNPAFQAMGELAMLGAGENPDRTRRANLPWADVVPVRQLVFDPLALTDRHMGWYAKMVMMPTSVLMDDKTLIQKAIKPSHARPELMNPMAKDILDKESSNQSYTAVWEVHDAVNQTWHWQTDEGELLFAPVDDPLQVDGLPLDTMVFNQSPISRWGTPDTIYIEPQQTYGNEARRIQLKHLRMTLTKYIVNEDMMTEAEVNKLFTEDVAAIRLNSVGQEGISNAIKELNHQMPFDLQSYTGQLFNDAQLISGISSNKLGQSFSGRRTRGEVEIVDAANETRMEERRQMVANITQNIFRKANQYMQSFWKEPMVRRVVGVEGLQHWVEMRPGDIKAELEVNVSVESLLPPSRERTKSEMIEVMKMLGQVNPEGVLPLMRKLLSNFPWADVGNLLPNAPQGGQAVSSEQFAQQQQQQLNNPGLGQETQQNLGALVGS